MKLSKFCRKELERPLRPLFKAAVFFGALGIASATLAQTASAGSQHREGEPPKMETNNFRALPFKFTIHVTAVAQKDQRYDTIGDWQWRGDALEIRISREVGDDDPRYALLLLTHEIVEAVLCRSTGVTSEAVDRFDLAFRGTGEPGDDPRAPYHRAHRAAEAAERALARSLTVDWKSYMGE